MKVLLSIKPEFVEKIFSGEKKFEYRRVIFGKPDVNTIVVYSTMPVGKIVGEFSIKKILLDNPIKIWETTKRFSGISKDSFFKYFEGKNIAYAIEIQSLKIYDSPINPYEDKKKFKAPQSFMYL
jgi:predicted transcriptional regulator